MSYQLTVADKPGYVHVVVTGPNTMECVSAYLEQVLDECVARHCRRVLIEERLEGPRLDTMSVFQVVSQASGRAVGYFKAIAYVDVNAEGNLMKFAENIAVNRTLPVRVFASVADAEKWLGEIGS